jgi:uncharacterized membrane protein
MMTWMDLLAPFGPIDAVALAVIFIAWLGSDWLIEYPPARHPSVTFLMQRYRREWMRQMVTRQPRIFDAQIVDSLRQGTAFFASTCMIAIGGGAAVIGNPTLLADVTADLAPVARTEGLELRVILVLLFLSDALLKFIWSNRLFGYCAVLMAAVPNSPDDPQAYARAAQAAEVNITAARNFNRGLRSVYFALTALAWLLGAAPLIAATALCVTVLLRREFASESRKVILESER